MATGVIALLTLVLRRNRAQVRYALWFTASMKFCVPFGLLVSAGGALAPSPRVPEVAASQAATPQLVSIAIDQLAQPFDSFVTSAPAPRSPVNWPSWALAVWIAGMAAVVAMRVRDWRRIRAVLRDSTEVAIDGTVMPAGVTLRSTASSMGPGVVGWWRYVLLLPAGLEQLPRPQLEAVIAHELCHVRRRDTHAAAAHMAVETVFWFHPLVWWIGARLVDERERACDEAVLTLGIDPVEYSSAILSVCRRYVEAPAAYVPGVTGSDLRARIESILTGRVGARLSLTQQVSLSVVAASILLLPITAGVLTAPLRAQQATTGTRAFEVASVKPCAPEVISPRPSSGAGTGGGAAPDSGANGPTFSHGRAYVPCIDLSRLIYMAYVASRSADRDPSDPFSHWQAGVSPQLADGTKTIVRGAPEWVYSEKFTIEAKAPDMAANAADAGARDQLAIMGPMLQSLIENRFKLKMHVEVEQASMFALVVSKSGLKVRPVPDGGCTKDRSGGAIVLSEATRLGVTPTCGTVSAGLHDGNWRYEHGGQALNAVAAMLSGELGVTVLDRTGISDIFNMTWEFAPDDSTPRAQRMIERYGPQPPLRPTAPALFTALEEQLGVSLVPIKESRGYYLVDHVERPSPNPPIASGTVQRH